MFNSITLEKVAPKYAKFKKTSNEIIARRHSINFAKEEEKFFKSSEKLAGYMDNYSLKAIPQFFKSVDHFLKMGAEKLKSAYYVRK